MLQSKHLTGGNERKRKRREQKGGDREKERKTGMKKEIEIEWRESLMQHRSMLTRGTCDPLSITFSAPFSQMALRAGALLAGTGAGSNWHHHAAGIFNGV